MKGLLNYLILPSILMLSILLNPGCLSIQTQVGGLEPQAGRFDDAPFEDLGYSEGESSSFRLLWMFPVTAPISYNEAVEDAISKKGGDGLIEVRTYVERQVWIVGTIQTLYVKGKVIRYQK